MGTVRGTTARFAHRCARTSRPRPPRCGYVTSRLRFAREAQAATPRATASGWSCLAGAVSDSATSGFACPVVSRPEHADSEMRHERQCHHARVLLGHLAERHLGDARRLPVHRRGPTESSSAPFLPGAVGARPSPAVQDGDFCGCRRLRLALGAWREEQASSADEARAPDLPSSGRACVSLVSPALCSWSFKGIADY